MARDPKPEPVTPHYEPLSKRVTLHISSGWGQRGEEADMPADLADVLVASGRASEVHAIREY